MVNLLRVMQWALVTDDGHGQGHKWAWSLLQEHSVAAKRLGLASSPQNKTARPVA
ncbi:MAG: hypothetical protein KBC57_06095 [Neisseriaceae bacterium]|nr:hypothetical protein [Neisseriaceae bacterium]MBP6861911.1 hypothetical protein [Neisseriaceae bacterium]